MTVSRTPPACPPQPPEVAALADAAGFPRRRLLRAAPALLLGPWLAARSPAAHADTIETANVRLEPTFEADGWALSADFAIPLSSRIEDAVNRGVPLYFVVEFELYRPRWYWWDDKVVQAGQTYRLSYHALTRQYRVSLNGYQQQYPSLADAVRTMSLLRGWKVIAADQVSPGTPYDAFLRMRLDVSQLPKPFQVNAITNRDWNLQAEWKRFAFTPQTLKSGQ